MQTQQVTGLTIRGALKEARRQFGDDVVLIESQAPENGQPARVTVMADQALPDAKQPRLPSGPVRTRSKQRVPSEQRASEPASPSLGYAPGMQRFNAQDGSAGTAAAVPEKPSGPVPPSPPETASDGAVRSLGRNRLFDTGAASAEAAQPAADGPGLESQLQLLNSRLDAMERRFGGAVIGSTQRWMANPLFNELVDLGLRPSTLTTLFDRLVDRGFEPDADTEAIRWAVAQEMRQMLDLNVPKLSRGSVLVMGPSGAGKTSMLLKLATHDSFFARRRTTVISIMPANDDLPYLNPADLYRQFGIPVQNVRTQEEMDRALQRADAFDQVLIDTPSLPMVESAARPMLKRIKSLVAPLMPLRTHLVLSVTRNLDAFDTRYIRHLPLRPDAIALTHLDETDRWGRVAEWLMTLGKPVQFVSTGRRVPAGVEAFSPSGYIEDLLNLH